MDFLALVVAVATVPVVYLAFWFFHKWNQKRHLPPGPFPLPILANTHLFRDENVQKTVYELSKTYGDVMTVWFGNRPTIIVNSITAAKDYLVKQGKTFAGRPQTKGTKLYCPKPGGLFMADYHDIWRVNRRISHGHFNPNGINIENMTNVINDEAKMLVENIQNQNGKPFYPKNMFLLAKMNVVFRLMFGIRNNLEDEAFQQIADVLQVMTIAGRRTFTKYLLRKIPFYKDDYNNAPAGMQFLREYFGKQFEIQGKTFDPDVKRHWADAMLKKNLQEGDESFRYQWAPCAIDLMVAGVDSSHNSMLWATVYLGLYPAIQQRLYEDITKATSKEEAVTYAKQSQLPYLMAFIHETLRLSCVTSFGLPHKSVCEGTLGGYTMKPGTLVMTNVYSLHHDEKYWKNPTEFKPERFINEVGKFFLPNESFLPFSIGMRACVGEQLAKMDLFGLLGSMIKNFEFYFDSDVKTPTLDAGRRDISWAPAYYTISAKNRME